MAVKKAKSPVSKSAVEQPTTLTPQSTGKKSLEIIKLMNDLNKKFGTNAVTLGFPKSENGEIKTIEVILHLKRYQE